MASNDTIRTLDELSITLDLDKHLKSVLFNDKLLEETCIKDMNQWDNIPKIAIITRKNGLAKTQLLEYIRKYVKE